MEKGITGRGNRFSLVAKAQTLSMRELSRLQEDLVELSSSRQDEDENAAAELPAGETSASKVDQSASLGSVFRRESTGNEDRFLTSCCPGPRFNAGKVTAQSPAVCDPISDHRFFQGTSRQTGEHRKEGCDFVFSGTSALRVHRGSAQSDAVDGELRASAFSGRDCVALCEFGADHASPGGCCAQSALLCAGEHGDAARDGGNGLASSLSFGCSG